MERFIDNNDETITDTHKWKMWEKEGSKKVKTFEDAKKYVVLIKLNMIKRVEGYIDWRLPTVQELESARGTFIFGGYYWADTDDNGFYWGVVDSSKIQLNADSVKETKFRVRCVRDITEEEKALILESNRISSIEKDKEKARVEIFRKKFNCSICGEKGELIICSECLPKQVTEKQVKNDLYFSGVISDNDEKFSINHIIDYLKQNNWIKKEIKEKPEKTALEKAREYYKERENKGRYSYINWDKLKYFYEQAIKEFQEDKNE
jgi:hypothetical protein